MKVIHVLQGRENESLSCSQIGFLNDAARLNWILCGILVEKKDGGGGGAEGRVPLVFRLLTVISLISEM